MHVKIVRMRHNTTINYFSSWVSHFFIKQHLYTTTKQYIVMHQIFSSDQEAGSPNSDSTFCAHASHFLNIVLLWKYSWILSRFKCSRDLARSVNLFRRKVISSMPPSVGSSVTRLINPFPISKPQRFLDTVAVSRSPSKLFNKRVRSLCRGNPVQVCFKSDPPTLLIQNYSV